MLCHYWITTSLIYILATVLATIICGLSVEGELKLRRGFILPLTMQVEYYSLIEVVYKNHDSCITEKGFWKFWKKTFYYFKKKNAFRIFLFVNKLFFKATTTEIRVRNEMSNGFTPSILIVNFVIYREKWSGYINAFVKICKT